MFYFTHLFNMGILLFFSYFFILGFNVVIKKLAGMYWLKTSSNARLYVNE